MSIVDHHERAVGQKQNKRALGVVLGEFVNGVCEITNSYAIPFDENMKQHGVWFIDNVYHEEMYNMFRKVNIKERFLGWYVTGSQVHSHDIQI